MNQIDRAREIIRQTWEADPRPFYVCFSGGKDSTLLLQLVLEVRDASENKKKVYASFANTGYEMNGKLAQMNKIWPQLEAIGVYIREVKPPPEKKILVRIIGDGYPSPDFLCRYCTSESKRDPQYAEEKVFALWHDGLIVCVGSRKEESVKRRKSLEKLGAPDVKELKHKRLKLENFFPLADVSTSELWEYLENLDKFKWGGTCDELVATMYSENKQRQRDGCWLCTVANESAGKCKLCARGQNEFRQFLRMASHDQERRHLITNERIRKNSSKYVGTTYAFGRFTLTARREILDKLQEAELLDGARYISLEEVEIIYRKWEETREQFGES